MTTNSSTSSTPTARVAWWAAGWWLGCIGMGGWGGGHQEADSCGEARLCVSVVFVMMCLMTARSVRRTGPADAALAVVVDALHKGVGLGFGQAQL